MAIITTALEGIIMKNIVIILITLLIFPVNVSATKNKTPPVTMDTINGVWEGINIGGGAMTCLVMRIDTKGVSLLAEGIDGSISFVSYMKSLNVNEGKLRITFGTKTIVGEEYRDKTYIPGIETIVGIGTATSEFGTLEVQFIRGEDPQGLQFYFIKSNDFDFSLRERIRRNFQAAFETIKYGEKNYSK